MTHDGDFVIDRALETAHDDAGRVEEPGYEIGMERVSIGWFHDQIVTHISPLRNAPVDIAHPVPNLSG